MTDNIEAMREALRKAIQLAEIACDWNLEEVEIDGKMVRTRSLCRQFKSAISPHTLTNEDRG
jgi:hypothetical protein